MHITGSACKVFAFRRCGLLAAASLYKPRFFIYTFSMFASVAIDPGSESRAKELADILGQYGFDKIQRGLWESAIVTPDTLSRLKRDLDKATDSFDRIRIFQFPVEGTLAITTLRDKKWRRMLARGGASAAPQTIPAQQAVPARPAAARPAAAANRSPAPAANRSPAPARRSASVYRVAAAVRSAATVQKT